MAGPLERPVFGQRPEPALGFRKPRPPHPYTAIIAAVAEHPGQWAKIAVWTTSTKRTPADTERSARNAKESVRRHLNKHRRLEHWEVSWRTEPGTWAHRALWLRFVGPWTELERAQHFARAKLLDQQTKQRAAQRRANRKALEEVSLLKARQTLRLEAPEG